MCGTCTVAIAMRQWGMAGRGATRKQKGRAKGKKGSGAGAASRSRARRVGKPVQDLLPLRSWGGARAGAGRKPKGPVAMMPRTTRPSHASYHPALVTVKLRAHLPRLRQQKERAALLAHLARGKDRFGFRLLHFAILNDHLHFVVEAKDRLAFTRGMKGLLVRLARGLNRLWGRKGQVFPDRFHERPLRNPREVRNALVFVLGNGRKHAAQGRAVPYFEGPDMFTSAPWFDGFVEAVTVRGIENVPPPVARPRTWLAGVGWRQRGRIGMAEMPKSG
jgi:REP element-mobilizing transposase RayT